MIGLTGLSISLIKPHCIRVSLSDSFLDCAKNQLDDDLCESPTRPPSINMDVSLGLGAENLYNSQVVYFFFFLLSSSP